MSIIEFLQQGGKAGEKKAGEMLQVLEALGIPMDVATEKLNSLDEETLNIVITALNDIVEKRNSGQDMSSAQESLNVLQKVFMPSEKWGGKLEQLVNRFAKGGKAIDCGCGGKKLKCGGKPKKKENGGIAKAQEGTLLWAPKSKAMYEEFMRLYGNKSTDTTEPIKSSQSFSQDYEKNFGDKIKNMTAATIAGYGTTPVKQTTVVEQTTVPYLTRRQARELSKENRGYDNSMFRTAYANMKAGLRDQDLGLHGRALRQQARYNVSGLRNPIESIPIVADNLTAGPIVMENPKNVPQNIGVLDLRGHNIGVIDDAAINNALVKAIIAGRAVSGRPSSATIDAEKQKRLQEIEDARNAANAANILSRIESINKQKSKVTPSAPVNKPEIQETEKRIASTIPAAKFNPRYAPGNWVMVNDNTFSPYSESYAARNVLNGTAGRTLQNGGELENPDWQQIWQNQRALPVENDSETAPLKPIQKETLPFKKSLETIKKFNNVNRNRNKFFDNNSFITNDEVLWYKNNPGKPYPGRQINDVFPNINLLSFPFKDELGGKVEKGQGGTRVGNEKHSVWKRLYNGVETALKGADYDLSEEEYLQKHGYIRPKATVAPLPTFRTPTQNPEDLARLKKVIDSGEFNFKPGLDFDIDKLHKFKNINNIFDDTINYVKNTKFTKPISWWDRNGEALLWTVPAVGIPSAIGGAWYNEHKRKKKEKSETENK